MSGGEALKTQAWLDGELPPAEAAAIARLVNNDAAARDLSTELRQTTAALAVGEPVRPVPESREFYWSKIERAIRAAEDSRPSASRPAWWRSLARWLVPAGFTAALAVWVASPYLHQRQQGSWVSGAEIESPLNDVGSFTFRSEAERMTVVWISTY